MAMWTHNAGLPAIERTSPVAEPSPAMTVATTARVIGGSRVPGVRSPEVAADRQDGGHG